MSLFFNFQPPLKVIISKASTMRHRQRAAHTYNVISYLLLLSLLIAAPIASRAARHLRSGSADNDKPGVESADLTPKAASNEAINVEEKHDIGNAAALVAHEANKTNATFEEDSSPALLENNEKATSTQNDENRKIEDAEQLQQENKELQIDIGDEDIEFIDNAGRDNDIANYQGNNLRECGKEFIGFEITTG